MQSISLTSNMTCYWFSNIQVIHTLSYCKKLPRQRPPQLTDVKSCLVLKGNSNVIISSLILTNTNITSQKLDKRKLLKIIFCERKMFDSCTQTKQSLRFSSGIKQLSPYLKKGTWFIAINSFVNELKCHLSHFSSLFSWSPWYRWQM